MNNKKLTFALFFNLFFFLATHAQQNFLSGYVINLNNDTLRGLVDEGTERQNSNLCSFKKGDAASIIKYTPNDILAYGLITNKHYLTKKIKLNDFEKNYFLECLVKGSISLYSLNDQG